MMTKRQRQFHAPKLADPSITTIERLTLRQLRDHRGAYAGDAVALIAIREYSAFAVARFQFSGPTKSEPAKRWALETVRGSRRPESILTMKTEEIENNKALHIDHGLARRSFTRDELLQFCKTWMREKSIDVGCSHEYYHARLGLIVDFATDLFDGPKA